MNKVKLASLTMGLLLAGAAGCGSNDDPGTPVKETQLQGTIKGQPYTAKSALVTVSGSKSASVTIYEVDTTCADRFKATGRQILLSVDSWSDGTSFQLGGTQDTPLGIPLPLHSVTFAEGSNNTIVSKGRVEVVKASGKDVAGILRLRADGGSEGMIEGQVSVTHCGG